MAVAMLLLAILLWQAPGAPEGNPAQPAASRHVYQGEASRAYQVEAGRRVYAARKCATCHMIAGEGNIRFKLDEVASRLSEADVRRWLTDTAAMERALPTQPAVRMSEWLEMSRKISDADVTALVAYLSTLK